MTRQGFQLPQLSQWIVASEDKFVFEKAASLEFTHLLLVQAKSVDSGEAMSGLESVRVGVENKLRNLSKRKVQ